MKATFARTTATGAMAAAMLTAGMAHAQTNDPIVEITTAIDMDVAAWKRDRGDASSFENANWQGREGAIKMTIAPPSAPSSFYNWQGYNQELDTPVGSASIKGDLWVSSEWASGTESDYIRTGIWGSAQSAGLTEYTDSQAVFPIISFTNENGVARLQVWDTTSSPEGGWVDLDASASALSLGSWNNFEMRVLPESDRIDYIVNGVTVYTWQAPRGSEGNIADELWAVYLKGRNNGVTTFDTYWSGLEQAELVLNGEAVNAAAGGFNVLAGAEGGVTVADGVSVGGTIHTGAGSNASITFGKASGVATSDAGEHGVASTEGGTVTLNDGSVTTSGTSAHGLYASGTNSVIETQGTAVSVTGAGAIAGYAVDGASIKMNGGSASSNRSVLVADGGTIQATNVALTSNVGPNNTSESGSVVALDGGSATVSGGTITLDGTRLSGLLALSEGTINATGVKIVATGDRSRGAYAAADSNGGGSLTINGGSIATNGRLSHGLFAKRESGTTAQTTATINATNVNITVDGEKANGAYSDAGGAVSVTGGKITVRGTSGVGLHAQGYDDGVSGGGTLTATNVAVITSGEAALGAYAELGGSMTINGGSITTTGASAHALAVSGNELYPPRLTANNVTIKTSGSVAVGIGVSESGSVRVNGGSITTGGDAIGVLPMGQSLAVIDLNGTTISSGNNTLLNLNRQGTNGSSGSVNLTLRGGSVATGDILDIPTQLPSNAAAAAPNGLTSVTISGSTLTGRIDGVRHLSFGDDALWKITGSGKIDLMVVGEAGGTLEVAPNVRSVLTTTLRGSGNLRKAGGGTLELDGNGSTYEGTLQIDAGRILLTGSMGGDVVIAPAGSLQIGNDNQSGDLTGSTVNDGLLVFARSDDYEYTGALSGNGGLIKRGDGVLLLSGDYQYTGSTVVEGGLVKLNSQLDEGTDLVVDNGTLDLTDKTQTVAGLSGSGGKVDIGKSGQLTINQNQNTTFRGSIAGSGTIIKTGTGTLTLSGTNAFSGGLQVRSGTLSVMGSAMDAAVSAAAGGTVKGYGTVGTLSIGQSGTLAAGGSIGTLHVVGDVSFGPGSIFEVEVDASGASDLVSAGGEANITGGTVSVLAAMGDYARFTDYLILSAAGGVNGTFDGTDVDMPFLDAFLNYSPTEVMLTLERNDVSFTSVAVTTNQLAVAGAIDSMAATSVLARSIEAQTTAETARQGFDALSGDTWASVGSLLVDQMRDTGQTVLGHLRKVDQATGAFGGSGSNSRAMRDGSMAIWGELKAAWNEVDSDGNAAGLTNDQYGFLTGLDMAVGDWRLGAAIGYTEADIKVASRSSAATAKTTNLAVYGGGGWGPVRLNVGATYGWHDVDGDRAISFPSFSETAGGRYDGTSTTVFGELGYALALGQTTVEPFAGVNYVHLKTDGFTETGGAEGKLTVAQADRDVTFTNLGLRLRTNMAVADTLVLAPHVSASWQHALGDDVNGLGNHALAGGSAFQVEGLAVSRDTAAIDAGIAAIMASGAMLNLSYSGNVADNWSDHGVRLGFSFNF